MKNMPPVKHRKEIQPLRGPGAQNILVGQSGHGGRGTETRRLSWPAILVVAVLLAAAVYVFGVRL